MNRISLFAIICLCAASTHGATLVWTNTLGGNWSLAGNWSPNQVPAAADDTALITNDGTYTVTMDASPSILGLSIGGEAGTQTVAKAFGSLTIRGASKVGLHGVFNLQTALTATNGLTIGGALNWNGGTIGLGSIVEVVSNGVMNCTGSQAKTLTGLVTNSGTIKWTGANANTSIDASGVLHNLSNGLLDGQTNVIISGAGRLINDGTIRRSFPTGSCVVNTVCTNNGVVNAQNGAIGFSTLTMGDGSSYFGTGPVSFLNGTMNGDINAENLAFLGSSLNGNGVLHGSLSWSNGAVAVGASLTIASNSTLTVAGSSTKTVAGILTNAGTIIWTNGYFGFTGTGAAYNLAGALLDAKGGLNNLNVLSGGSVGLVNDGVIRKSAGSGTMLLNLPLLNRGTIEAASGFISLGSGTTLGDGSSYTGAGTNTTGSGVNIRIDGSITSENLRIDAGASLHGTGIVHGVVVWNHGSIQTDAALTVAEDAILNATGDTSVMFISGSLTNAGVINWKGPSPLQFTGGRLHNLSSGNFDMRTNAAISTLNSGRFINDGILRKTAGMGTNNVIAGVVFTNNGIVSVQTGTVRFDGGLFNPSGTLEVQGGKIASTVPLVLTNGLITGSGIIEAPSIISAATINPGATNAVLTISGNYTQQLAGTLEFDIAGTEPGTSHSQVIVTGNAELNGTVGVRFASGYSPAVGESNAVFTAASLSGDFDCSNGFLILGENKRLVRSYSSTNMVLTTIAAPDPVSPTLNISKGDQVLICWPSEFTGYTLYTNDDLGSTNWVAVTGATNRFLEMPTSPLKFFGLFEE